LPVRTATTTATTATTANGGVRVQKSAGAGVRGHCCAPIRNRLILN